MKRVKIYKILSEWDLGLTEVYATKEAAMASLRQAHKEHKIEESVESCFANGLYDITLDVMYAED